MIRNLLALLGLGAVLLATALGLQAYGAFDDDHDAPPRIAVSYAGIDLATPEGIRMLEGRIDAAINDICADRGTRGLKAWQNERECRRDAIASVEPQVAAAIERARDRNGYADGSWRDRDASPVRDDGYDDYAEAQPYPSRTNRPVVFAPPAEVVQPLPTERRLVRRTTTVTTTVTRRGGSAVAGAAPGPYDSAPPRPAPAKSEMRPAHTPAKRPVKAAYARLPEVPGSWLPTSAWRAIERATVRAFATGRLTRWMVRGREGYVTVSAPRWIKGCACRNVKAVKYAHGRQIVVAAGRRCTLRGVLR